MNDAPTYPIGLLIRAQEFVSAGDVVLNAAGDKVSLPAYFLFGHSVELSLKAFLMGSGMSVDQLRSRKYGHDLSALLEASQEKGLANEVKVKQDEAGAIELLAYDYMAKRFEYHLTDTYRLPYIEITQHVTQKLAFRLEPFCRRASPPIICVTRTRG